MSSTAIKKIQAKHSSTLDAGIRRASRWNDDLLKFAELACVEESDALLDY